MPRTTLQCCPRQHYSVAHANTAVSPTATQTEIYNNNKTPIANIGEQSSVFDDVVKQVAERFDAKKHLVRQSAVSEEDWAEMSAIQKVMKAIGCQRGTEEYARNFKTFSKELLRIGNSRAMDTIDMFESQRRQGELGNIKNPAAYLMSCFQAVPSRQ